jgi:hypothetical protein
MEYSMKFKFLMLSCGALSFLGVQGVRADFTDNEGRVHLSRARESSRDSANSRVGDKTLHFGTQVQYFDYKENVPGRPDFKSEERGVLPGAYFGYSSRIEKQIALDIGASYHASDILYDGALQNGTPMKATSGLELLQMQATFSFLFVNSDSDEMGTYGGLMFRRWDRKIDAKNETPAGSYDEAYTTVSAPIGLRWTHSIGDSFRFGLDGSIAIPLRGNFEIIFPGRLTTSRLPISLSNELKMDLSWKVQAPIEYSFSRSIGLSLNPFFESISYKYSYIGRIGNVSVSEPASRTYQWGSQLKLLVFI